MLSGVGRFYSYPKVPSKTNDSHGDDHRNRFAEKRPTVAVFSRRALLVMVLVCALLTSGCLSVDPGVESATDGSAVFKEFSVGEPWASNHVWANATLASTPAASNVTTISVIQENGRVFSTQQVTTGQTTVYLALPTDRTATVVAVNTVNSTTVARTNVTVTGTDPIPF